LDRERLGDVVGNVLDKAYKLKASDCTTLHTIFVPENLYEDFYQVLREKARDLIVGNIIERETDLPQYDKKTLQKLDGAIKYMNGKAKKSESFSFEITQDVNVKKNQAGVILTRFNSVEEEDMELVGESHGVPFINVVKYKELDEARAGAQMIIDGYNLKTGIDQFMYIALFGKLQAEHKDMFQPLTYLVKENSASFDISRPHNGRYLVERMLI
jgi:delta 1-pyrroline-5-carboxylate dehydrogenase